MSNNIVPFDMVENTGSPQIPSLRVNVKEKANNNSKSKSEGILINVAGKQKNENTKAAVVRENKKRTRGTMTKERIKKKFPEEREEKIEIKKGDVQEMEERVTMEGGNTDEKGKYHVPFILELARNIRGLLKPYNSKSDNWGTWSNSFNAYASLAKISSKDQFDLIQLFVDEDVRQLIKLEGITTFKKLSEVLRGYRRTALSPSLMYQELGNLKQNSKTLLEYINELKRIMTSFNIDDDETLLQYAVLGLKDPEIKRHFLVKFPTSIRELLDEERSLSTVLELSIRNRSSSSDSRTPNNTRWNGDNKKNTTPCYYCGKIGHLSSNCWFKPENQIQDSVYKRKEGEPPRKKFKETAQIMNVQQTSSMSIPIRIGSAKILALIDTGADCSIIEYNFLQSINLNYTLELNDLPYLIHAGNGTIQVIGRVSVPIYIGDNDQIFTFIVVNHFGRNLILGNDFLSINEAIINFQKQTVGLISKKETIENPTMHSIRFYIKPELLRRQKNDIAVGSINVTSNNIIRSPDCDTDKNDYKNNKIHKVGEQNKIFKDISTNDSPKREINDKNISKYGDKIPNNTEIPVFNELTEDSSSSNTNVTLSNFIIEAPGTNDVFIGIKGNTGDDSSSSRNNTNVTLNNLVIEAPGIDQMGDNKIDKEFEMNQSISINCIKIRK